MRTGPTADAIRRRQVAEVYARTVLNDPRSFVERKNISIHEDLVRPPVNEAVFFDSEHEKLFYESLFSWTSHVARERDTKSVSNVMRRRKSFRSTDLFNSKSVMITHNPAFAKISQRFCIDEGLIERGQVGPVVHQRRFAALIWLTLGADERINLSRRQLIANCANAVGTRSGVIESMRHTLSLVKPEMKDQLDALMTRPRSVQLAMDLTLGTEQIVTAENIEKVFELIRATTTEEERKRHQSDLDKLQKKLGAEIQGRTELVSELEAQLEAERARSQEILDTQRGEFEKLAKEVNGKVRFISVFCTILISLIVVAAVTITSSLFSVGYWILLICSLIIGILTITPFWPRPTNLIIYNFKKMERKIGDYLFKRKIRGGMLENFLVEVVILWGANYSFTWKASANEGKEKVRDILS
jgi:hypothetical protein